MAFDGNVSSLWISRVPGLHAWPANHLVELLGVRAGVAVVLLDHLEARLRLAADEEWLRPRRRGRSLLVWSASGVLVAAAPTRGQELEPRSYVNTPVGLNFLIAGYGYTHGDVVFSASPIEDAKVDAHAPVVAYLRSFDLFGLSAKAGVIVPFAQASGHALVAGQRREREIFGLADPTLRRAERGGSPSMRRQAGLAHRGCG